LLDVELCFIARWRRDYSSAG